MLHTRKNKRENVEIFFLFLSNNHSSLCKMVSTRFISAAVLFFRIEIRESRREISCVEKEKEVRHGFFERNEVPISLFLSTMPLVGSIISTSVVISTSHHVVSTAEELWVLFREATRGEGRIIKGKDRKREARSSLVRETRCRDRFIR